MKPVEIVAVLFVLAAAGVAVWYILHSDKAAAEQSPLQERVPGVPLSDDPTAVQRGEAVAGIKTQADLVKWVHDHPMGFPIPA